MPTPNDPAAAYVPAGGAGGRSSGSAPIPDPTVLTDAAIAKAITLLTVYIDGKIAHTDEKLRGLEQLTNERFNSIERLRVEQKIDTKAAVDAALTAQKEAVGKSEAATNKQLEGQQTATSTSIGALRSALEDTRSRHTDDMALLRQSIVETTAIATATVERKAGAKEDRTALYAGIGIIGTILGIVIAAGAIIAAGAAGG